MLLTLLKKDFLIVKRYALILLVIAIIIPPFMLWRAPEFTGALGFMLAVIFVVFMLLQYVSLMEYQFPKASAFLCAMPLPRSMMVLSKYLFCLVVYGGCCLIFVIETLFISGMGSLDIQLLALTFFTVAAFIGVYLPVQYKLGYARTRFVFMAVIVASPFILPLLMKNGGLHLGFLNGVSPLLLYGGIILAGVLILLVSALLSMAIYAKADLA